MIKTYYLLTKPGIIAGNLITTAGGFALASQGHMDYVLFLMTMLGLGCIIASACIFNNYIDREADRKMSRTQDRPLAQGLISGQRALAFALLLCLIGSGVLAFFINAIALTAALGGFFIYVVLYSFWKYHSNLSTIVGSIAGALPPVVGYCAVSKQLDAAAILLFFIMVLWQMPHFFSIALFRFDDYVSASIPVLPITKGILTTKVHMLLYIIAFIFTTLLLTAFGYTGYLYLAIATSLGLAWLILCIKGFNMNNHVKWARQMFVLSLVVITGLCSTFITQNL